MFQRTSLNWQLSALSPVWIAKDNFLPVTGPRPILLMACTIASATCVVRISCGR